MNKFKMWCRKENQIQVQEDSSDERTTIATPMLLFFKPRLQAAEESNSGKRRKYA
jgi:hypothetical protein